MTDEGVSTYPRGIPARWTSSAKSGVGTALSPASRVWFTVSHGILNEIYYPRVDRACTRDLGLVVTGPGDYFSEEKRHTRHLIEPVKSGVPAYRLTNTAADGAYRIEKRILTDPSRPSVLQDIVFTPLKGEPGDYRVYALLSPHLFNCGMGNTAWIGDYKGWQMLFATGRDGVSLALASSLPWLSSSAGYVGVCDGWLQLLHRGALEPGKLRADDGNVSLTGQIGFSAESNRALLSLGLAGGPDEAGYNALASLMAGFDAAAKPYVSGWRTWQSGLQPLDRIAASGRNIYRISTAVLAAHRSAAFPGPVVASLSVPWGFDKGDDDLGGYHLVWPRDLVETAGGFLAAGAGQEALEILAYLRAIQESDGHWPQNAWLDGMAYWSGIQMDECGFPILLADALRRNGALPHDLLPAFLPMIVRAAAYLVGNGPVTGEDRWEEDAGYSPFTVAVEVAALLAAADFLEDCGKSAMAVYLRETADAWNDQIERWTYVTGTGTATALGIDGYYVRIAPPDIADASSASLGYVPIKNRPPGDTDRAAELIVSPDALALVRFGLRAADDPRIVNTVRAIDAHLCDIKEMQIRDGLHIFGVSPSGRMLTDLTVALARVPRGLGDGGDRSLQRAIAEDAGLAIDGVLFDPLDCDMGAAWGGPRQPVLAEVSDDPWRSNGDTVERIELLAMRLVSGDAVCPADWAHTQAVLAEIEARLKPATIRACCGSVTSGTRSPSVLLDLRTRLRAAALGT